MGLDGTSRHSLLVQSLLPPWSASSEISARLHATVSLLALSPSYVAACDIPCQDKFIRSDEDPFLILHFYHNATTESFHVELFLVGNDRNWQG
jgi:hypothetical protein